MDRHSAIPDMRGGGDASRRDAFRYAPRWAVLGVLAMIGLGVTAIAIAAYDIGDVRAMGDAGWLSLAGLFVVLFGFGLGWIALRRPVLLVVGPEGLDLAAAFERPLPWTGIHRIRRTGWRVSLLQKIIMLRVDLVQGVRPDYKLRPWTLPVLDAWAARRFGLRVPLQNLDADEETIIASIERFKPVLRVAV